MPTPEQRLPIHQGEFAPNFTLPAVERDGTVSLADYRGRFPLLIGLFRGVYCPLCRRKDCPDGTRS